MKFLNKIIVVFLVLPCLSLSASQIQKDAYDLDDADFSDATIVYVLEEIPFLDRDSDLLWTYFEFTQGKWVGCGDSYASVGLFAPAVRSLFDKHLLGFVNVQGHVLSNGEKAANVGGGIRYSGYDELKVYGLNIFYDCRQKLGHTLSQVGIGLERLGIDFDMRVNAYFPFGDKQSFSSQEIHYPGGYSIILEKREEAMSGFDFEIGGWFRRKQSIGFYGIYGVIGGYCYTSDIYKNLYGGFARILTTIGKYFFAEAKGACNRASTYCCHKAPSSFCQVKAGIAFPLDFFLQKGEEGTCQWRESAFVQPVQRQPIIALDDRRCCFRHWNWDGGG